MKGLTLEASLHHYGKFTEWIDKYIPQKRATVLKEFFGVRELTLSSSPYSIKQGGVGAYPGGWIVTVNKMIECALVLNKVWERFDSEVKYSPEELVFSAIMCEIGKLGTNDQPFFLVNDNDWEVKNRGLLFKYNRVGYNMKYSDKALYILQENKIEISQNEYLAIKLYNSMRDEENSHYFNWDNKMDSNIAFVLNQAHTIVNNSI
jgi:hypothetical protein